MHRVKVEVTKSVKNSTSGKQDLFWKGWSQQLDYTQAQNGTGPGVRRIKRSLFACHNRCKSSMEILNDRWKKVKLCYKRKKEEIWLSPMTKAPIPKEKSKTWQHKNATKLLDYTTIAERLRTVSWSNDSGPTGAVKLVTDVPTLPLTTTVPQSRAWKCRCSVCI